MNTELKLNHPVASIVITQGFGENPEIYKQFGRAGHNGIDYGVPTGTPVMAAADGLIEDIGNDKNGYGNYVKINHGGYWTLYGHLEKAMVQKEQVIEQGEVIGYSNNTGFSTGPHLHFELRIPENKSTDYPAGETNPFPYFEALSPTQDIAPPSDQVDPSESKPITQAQEETQTEYPHINCRITATAGLRMHLNPNLASYVLGYIPYGMSLPIIETDGDWVGVLVWISKKYVEIPAIH
jgi:murein DD-endopeptidase MepM/ murein hydrolase activator NlpD